MGTYSTSQHNPCITGTPFSASSRPPPEAERDWPAAAAVRRGPVGLRAVHVLDQPDGAAAPQRDGARARPARRHGAQARHRQGGGVRGEAGPRTPRQAQMQGELRINTVAVVQHTVKKPELYHGPTICFAVCSTIY